MINNSLFIVLVLVQLLILSLTLPGTLELLTLTLAAIFPKKCLIKNRSINESTLPKLVIVIPAHNEAEGIAACIENLQLSLNKSSGCDLVVIADNC